jgi:ABC-type enterochelin transport system substrate-binding protein
MRTSSLKEIKDELKHASQEELILYCLRMAKYKKDNKELLTYLMFEAENDQLYINDTKEEIDKGFSEVNKFNMWAAKKQVRKILAQLKKNIRYAQKKEVEIELLLHFCERLSNFHPVIDKNKILQNTLDTQLRMTKRSIGMLHPDLQRDYFNILEEIG